MPLLRCVIAPRKRNSRIRRVFAYDVALGIFFVFVRFARCLVPVLCYLYLSVCLFLLHGRLCCCGRPME